MRQPNITEIVAFLGKYKPEALQELQQGNKQYVEILSEGSILGEGDTFDQKELKVRAKVSLQGMELAIKKCDELLPSISKKLKFSNRLQLFGQIITTVSGASVITTLQTEYKEITLIASILALLGGLVPLIVGTLNKTLNSKNNLNDSFENLVELKLKSDRLLNELKFYLNNDFNIPQISDIINNCNQICDDILKLTLFS